MAQPAMTSKQHNTSMIIRILGILEERYSVRRMKMRQIPPSGNWNKMESRVDHTKFDTIKGLKLLTALLTV